MTFDEEDVVAYKRGKKFWGEATELEKELPDFERGKVFKRMWDKQLDGARAAYEDLKANPEEPTPGEKLDEGLRRGLARSNDEPTTPTVTKDNLSGAILSALMKSHESEAENE